MPTRMRRSVIRRRNIPGQKKLIEKADPETGEIIPTHPYLKKAEEAADGERILDL